MFDTIMGIDKLSIPCAVSQVTNCSVSLRLIVGLQTCISYVMEGFWHRTCLGVAPMLNGLFIGGGHIVWRPILVCLPPHRVHSCRARPCRMNRTNLTTKKDGMVALGGVYNGDIALTRSSIMLIVVGWVQGFFHSEHSEHLCSLNIQTCSL
jgi:hypothetical protein